MSDVNHPEPTSDATADAAAEPAAIVAENLPAVETAPSSEGGEHAEAEGHAEDEPHAQGGAPAEGEPRAETEGSVEGEPHAEGGEHAVGPDGRPAVSAKKRPRDPAVLRAFRAGLPVEGTVEKVIKGGYEVRVGRLRGFCPHSQMDLHRVENPDEHVGKTYAWRILQLRRGGEDVVVSRRALLEEERGEEMKAVRATLVEGSVMSGHVARIAEFGVFVDLGAGVTGLVHLTEISHARVGKPADVVSVGDFVSVRLLRIDDQTGKLSLSMKQAQDDPWASVPGTIREGDRIEGTVRRHVDFGAFVEVRPGLEALVPARELPPTPSGWRGDLSIGTQRPFVVLAVDAERRRLTVLPEESWGAACAPDAVVPGARLKGRVQKCETFGVFVWLAPGKVGLMPKVWTGVPYGQPFEPKYPVGAEVVVDVVEITEDGKRIRLAAEGVSRREAEEPRRAPRPRFDRGSGRSEREEAPSQGHATEPAGAFGTNLGDALKAALERRER